MASGEVSTQVLPTGRVTQCCAQHTTSGRCCDPEDCGPCCPECPDCPTLAAVPTIERKLARRELERRMTRTMVELRYGPTVWPTVAPRPIVTPPQVRVPLVDLRSLVTGRPLPWELP